MQGSSGCGWVEISGVAARKRVWLLEPGSSTHNEFRIPARPLSGDRGDSAAPANQYSRRVGNRNHGRPTRTPLSTTATCQQEKTENWTEKHWPPTRTLGVRVGPRQWRFQTGENHGTKYSRNVWDNADGRKGCCQRKRRGNLGLEGSGSPTWIRTTIHGSKGRCPTVRRSGNGSVSFKYSQACAL